MATFFAETQIAASAETVWSVLTDVQQLRSAGFGLLSLEGDIALGGRVSLRSEAAPKQTFHLTVSDFQPPHRMVWRGGIPFGLFTGLRTFDVTKHAEGVHFRVSEDFQGRLAGVFGGMVPDLTPSLETFAAGLKRAAEAQS